MLERFNQTIEAVLGGKVLKPFCQQKWTWYLGVVIYVNERDVSYGGRR